MRPPTWYQAAAMGILTALLVGACGGGEPTATPAPTPTATPPPPTATTAPRATPTPTSGPGAVPTPIIIKGGKRGGTLQLSSTPGALGVFDTFDSAGKGAVAGHSLFLNNLLWYDPYGDGKTLVGDVARDWVISGDGKIITFTVRPGITFHDGKPLTSKDVVYNIERGWKPRSPTMTAFKGRMDALEKVEAPDDYTVRVTLLQPSNFFLLGLAISQFLVYPAHMPLPEFNSQWKATSSGSGPFKLKEQVGGTKIEAVRNEGYWKPGLPYLDGVTITGIGDASLVLAAFRAGRLDATSLDYPYISDAVVDGTLQREQGFVPLKVAQGASILQFNQKPPWTDPRVREAIDLALDRPVILKLGVKGLGTIFGAPVLPPELGGQWGMSEQEMRGRPGYREDKAQDLARAKQLLTEAGVNPSAVQTRITVTGPAATLITQVMEASVRELGFKVEVQPQEIPVLAQSRGSGAYEITVDTLSLQLDDPLDYLGVWVKTGASFNFGKWSDPRLDSQFDEQDRTLDPTKRKEVLRQIQETVMMDRHTLFMNWKYTFVGGNRSVKNYPPNLRFTFDSRFRWEQVWLER